MDKIDTSVNRRPYHHQSTPPLSSTPQLSPIDLGPQTPENQQRPFEPISKHSELEALTMPSSDLFLRLPLPHRILRDMSPPQTPKGHPLENGFRRHYPITNPYIKATIPYHLPRRLRPFVLLSFCIFVFGLVFFNQLWVPVDLELETPYEPIPTHVQHAHLAYQGRPSVHFENTAEELVALISFVTATHSNSIHDIDPTVPLDPSVVLDFDPGHPNARDDLDLLIDHVNTVTPLVLFGKMRDPWHREVQKILAGYRITPAPLVIDVDQRRDHRVFIPLLERLLGTAELPQLVIQGTVLGSYHDILEMQDAGTLTSLEASGLVIRDATARRKGVKERERLENERILQPAPIIDVA